MEDLTSRAHEIQSETLEDILSQNADVEYLRRHGLHGRTDREAFKKFIPVVSYEDIKPDIARIANGESSSILTSQPVEEFFMSSGTSGGESKLLPVTRKHLQKFIEFYRISRAITSHHFRDLQRDKIMHLMFYKPEIETPGGIPARAATTSFLKNQLLRENCFDSQISNTSPIPTVLCSDYHQSLYSQILCGLLQNMEVRHIATGFASGLVRAIRFMEKNWQLFADDIKTGTMNALVTDPSVRESVAEILKPNPKLADFIISEFEKESGKGIVRRIWPNASIVTAILTGSMAQYVPTLQHYCDGIPLVSSLYGSSECFVGVNLHPFCEPREVSYTIVPSMAYFEFIPVHSNCEEIVDLTDVKLGEQYEIVVTTYSGLYRYRVGDVLRVAGFTNSSPRFSFVCRKNVVLSIDVDKTDENTLQTAVSAAETRLLPYNSAVVDYTSYADTTGSPGHYVLFWELSQDGSTSIPVEVLEECCAVMEESLDCVYRGGRAAGIIGPLEIKVVEAGTFEKLMDNAARRGTTMSQYKTPRCLASEELVEFMRSKVVASYFSRRCPNWVAAVDLG